MSGASNGKVPKAPLGTCNFYIARKKRFCRFNTTGGEKYCPEHAGILGVETSKKRIKCPLNNKHTCYEDKLEKHLRKCKSRQTHLQPAYHIRGINSGCPNSDTSMNYWKIMWSEIPLEELLDFIERVKARYKEFAEDITTDIQTHDCLQEEMSNKAYGIPAIRHRKQQASLIGHLEKMGLLYDGICYVEMGAGKGMLSHWIQKALKDCKDTKFILVDKGHVRYKADNQHKWGEEGPKFERIQIDISDLHLGMVPSIADCDNPVVAVGKHVCGCATDLALRCLTQTLDKGSVYLPDFEPDRKKPKLQVTSVGETDSTQTVQRSRFAGLTLALCCHHRCEWTSYVGKEFMATCKFTQRDFALLCKLSGWTACTWQGWTSVQQMLSETQDDYQKDIAGKNSDTKSVTTSDLSETQQDSKESNENCEKDTLKLGVQVEEATASQTDKETNDGESPCGEEEHQPAVNLTRRDLKLEAQERETIGRMCKRLIDYGRVHYLRKHNLECKLTEYIEQKLTPENVAIVAHLPRK